MPLQQELFQNPPASMRGAPFWSLNCDMNDHERLFEHIDAFEEMGLGGYHLHVRPGLKTPYLSEDFLTALRVARDHGNSKGMLSYLYDEDTWPSGFAGGVVTEDLAYRQRWMQISSDKPEENKFVNIIAAYEIESNDSGYLINAKQVDPETTSEQLWYASLCIAPDNDRFNGAAYLDVLNPQAIDKFIECTHSAFLNTFDGAFPKDVPAIFTDEPQMACAQEMAGPFSGTARIPWTDDLADSFQQAYNVDIIERLPFIFWPTVKGPDCIRWKYWDHVTERFASAFADRIGDWCEKNQIALTGHMNAEADLHGQIGFLGEAMRHYRGFQIPGIDILCDKYEPATAKQAVSVARQDGRQQVMSELYGVTNWDFPFSGHKCQGDWQAAMGINLRVPHLAWTSMEGQSKRDYPAAIGIQSPWYKEYKIIEDHFARVHTALATGNALVRVGVIHSIESAWLHKGVVSLDRQAFDEQQMHFQNCMEWLIDGQIDFDFIAESLLPQQHQGNNRKQLQVGEMHYDVIILPSLENIRQSTLDILQAFVKNGGSVLVAGSFPQYCNGEKHSDIQSQLENATHVEMNEAALLEALDSWREISIDTKGGTRRRLINHQLRQDDDERILFCSYRLRQENIPAPWAMNDTPYKVDSSNSDHIRMRGEWEVRELNTMTGHEEDCAFYQDNGWTYVPWNIFPHDHRLLRFIPGTGQQDSSNKNWQVINECAEPQTVIRSEDNVLLLDQPEWRVDDEEWQPAQDSITTQLSLLDRFGWPDWAQPYSVKDPAPYHKVSRRFTIHSDIPLSNARLMCERMNEAIFILNGETINLKSDSWWVDRDLTCGTLPDLEAGTHTLEVQLMLDGVNRHLEWCYLLGDFGVEIRGAHARIIASDKPCYWGDLVNQDMPFYGGNNDYHFDITIEEDGDYALRIPCFGGSLLRVFCENKDCGPIAFAPFRAELGQLNAGTHMIRICAYGNRHNCFGALHNSTPGWKWFGPPAWRSQDLYSNRIWQLKPSGILRTPFLEKLG